MLDEAKVLERKEDPARRNVGALAKILQRATCSLLTRLPQNANLGTLYIERTCCIRSFINVFFETKLIHQCQTLQLPCPSKPAFTNHSCRIYPDTRFLISEIQSFKPLRVFVVASFVVLSLVAPLILLDSGSRNVISLLLCFGSAPAVHNFVSFLVSSTAQKLKKVHSNCTLFFLKRERERKNIHNNRSAG